MNLFKRLKTYFLFKNSPKKNKDVTYGSELEIYDSNIVYTNRYQNYKIPSNDFETKGVKFLSNIIIEISLNPDTIYCKEYFKFLNMLSIGSIRYTHLRDKGVMLLYISGNIFDYESLICANIESSNILIETIVRLLETLPSMGFSRIMTKNIIPEHRFSYDNNYNYDDFDLLKPYKDFKTAIDRFDPEKIADIIEIDHAEYAMSKYKEVPATRLSNIIFISDRYINIDGYTITVERRDKKQIFVYSMRIDDFIIKMQYHLTIFTDQSSEIFCKLMDIIYDENIGNYFNIKKEKNNANIFNITPINLSSVIDDYTEDEEYDESEDPSEENENQYQSFYEGVDEILSEEEIQKAEEYIARVNKQADIQLKI